MAFETFLFVLRFSTGKSHRIFKMTSILLCQKKRCMKRSATHWLQQHGGSLEKHRYMSPICSPFQSYRNLTYLGLRFSFPQNLNVIIYAYKQVMLGCGYGSLWAKCHRKLDQTVALA